MITATGNEKMQDWNRKAELVLASLPEGGLFAEKALLQTQSAATFRGKTMYPQSAQTRHPH